MTENTTVTNERVRLLYSKANASILTVLIAVVLFGYIFRNHLPQAVLVFWLIYMSTAAMLRAWLVFDYGNKREQVEDHQSFENRYVLTMGMTGMGWAYFIMQGLLLADIEYRLYSLLLLVSIISASVPVLSSSIRAVIFYTTPPLLVSLPVLFIHGENEVELGLGLIIFAYLVIHSCRATNKVLIENIDSRIRAQELNEDLEQMQKEKAVTEKFMRGIMDNSKADIYIRDNARKFVYVNREVLSRYKCSEEEIIGKGLQDLYPEDVADEMRSNDIEVLESHQSREYEEFVPGPDGIRRYVSVKFPLLDDIGEIYALGGISTDISQLDKAEESLRKSQQRLRLHFQRSPVGVIDWDMDFKILDWNPAAEKIFGYTREEVLGKEITETILDKSQEKVAREKWERMVHGEKESFISTNENLTRDGEKITCDWINTPLIDDNGNVFGVTSIVEDVTERRKNEDALRHSQKMDAIGSLTGGIAHDFNNMLGVIMGFAELLRARITEEDPKIIKYGNEIIEASERARKLTSKLLEFSRKSPTSPELTDINRLVDGMQHMLERTLTARYRMELDLQEGLWPVYLDKTQLEDAILNVCINSMHAMEDGGCITLRSCNIHLSEVETTAMNIAPGDYVLLAISDTGSGMSEEVRQKAFEPFFSTKGARGTGLGLSQLYGFVKRSEGITRLHSMPGEGTRIELYFPRHLQESEIKEVENQLTNDELPKGSETVLVVDDEEALLDLFDEILSTYGYQVLRADSGEKAMQLLEENTAQLMISDVIMPEMDGYQLAEEVQKNIPR